MEHQDISLLTQEGRFIHRAGAIILRDNHLLMVDNDKAPYYYTVGGRVRFGETSAQAVVREVWEETATRFAVERLLFVHENFFVWELDDRPCHEVSLYYLMSPPDNWDLTCATYGENGGRESLRWLPMDRLGEYQLFPSFLPAELPGLSQEVRHYVTRD